MRKTKILLTTLVVILVVITSILYACNLENADYEEDIEVTDIKSSTELINSFVEETLKDPNFVVTCKNKDGEVQYVETVVGTSCYISAKDGSEVYAYKKGEFYYMASISQMEDDEGNLRENRYYYCSDSTKPGYYNDSEEWGTMEELYKSNYCSFMNTYLGINLVSVLPDDGATISCKVHSEKKEGALKSSLSFEYSLPAGKITITAESEENKVKTIRMVNTEGAESIWSFEYGKGSITLPDTDAWDREEAEEEARQEGNAEALENKANFFEETFCAENVKVTVNTGNEETSYSDTIVDGKECIEYNGYKIYLIVEELDDGECNTYYVFDSADTKYKLLNDDAFNDVTMNYYFNGICAYDALAEGGATLTCEIEDNTLTFTISMDGVLLATLEATKNGDLVTSATYTLGSDDSVEITYTFVYDEATIEDIDLDDYELSSPNANDEDPDE